MKKSEYDTLIVAAGDAIGFAIDKRRQEAGVAARERTRLNSPRGTKDCIIAARDKETPWI
jgi:hypothetical protein